MAKNKVNDNEIAMDNLEKMIVLGAEITYKKYDLWFNDEEGGQFTVSPNWKHTSPKNNSAEFTTYWGNDLPGAIQALIIKGEE
jgi:hypothetical protein